MADFGKLLIEAGMNELKYLGSLIRRAGCSNMELRKIQEENRRFVKDRHWDKFRASLVFAHLIEEMGEIGRQILFEEGYKVRGLGHRGDSRATLRREFAQVFILFLQLANHYKIDLQEVFESEMKIMRRRFAPEKWKKYMAQY